jgi:biopolymer transport protein ExbD
MGLTTEPLEGPIGTNYTADGIRKVLLEKNATIDKLVVLIKAADKAVYKNVVDILDEMNISNIKRYALVEITPEDLDLIKKLE